MQPSLSLGRPKQARYRRHTEHKEYGVIRLGANRADCIAILSAGEVYIGLDAQDNAQHLALAYDDTLVPLSPIPASPAVTETIWADTSALPGRARSSPRQFRRGRVFVCWVNEHTDWCLNGHETIEVMFTQRHAPARVTLGSLLHVPSGSGAKRLRGYLAIHRGGARLCLHVRNRKTGRVADHSIDFDPACIGGPDAAAHQWIDVDLGPQPDGCDVSVEMQYQSYADDGTGIEPFLFLSGLHLADPEAERAAESVTLGPAPQSKPEQWFKAPLPVPAPDGISVQRDGQSLLRARLPARPLVTLGHDDGARLTIASDTPCTATLVIDGTTQRQVRIGRQTVLHLPRRFCDGRPHLVELLDASGSYQLWHSDRVLPEDDAPPAPHSLPDGDLIPERAILKSLTNRMQPTTEGLVLPGDTRTALRILETGAIGAGDPPLEFPAVTVPDVSVVMPVHNQPEATLRALASLRLAWNEASFDVIVVDDGSGPRTVEMLAGIKGITCHRNETATGFLEACNAGAIHARGKFIVLLNNDVEVTYGWLDPLISGMHKRPRAGMVGARLIYPDGSLQEAGGIVWQGGIPWNYGRGAHRHDPRYAYARQVDYLSGAALMIRTDLWQQLGGFDARYKPMYFEDTDLAFRVRAAGYETWYIPSSVIIHYEGITAGTDLTSGMKRFQAVNQITFSDRWRDSCATHAPVGQEPHLEKDRNIIGRALFIDYDTPRPDRDAGSVAAIQEMTLVRDLGYKVTFASTGLDHVEGYTQALQDDGIETVYRPFVPSIQDLLRDLGPHLDVVYMTRHYVAHDTLAAVRRFAPQARVLMNLADLHHLREKRAAEELGDADLMAAAERTRESELDAITQVDATLTYSDAEKTVIETETNSKASVFMLPWVVTPPAAVAGLRGRSGMSFLGNFNHPPNADAVEWFGETVLPGLSAECGALHVYGAHMSRAMRDRATERLIIKGYVPDIADAYAPHRMFVAPLRFGAGIKGKVISAIAHGIPTVLSPIAAEATGLRHEYDCLIAESPEDWHACITRLSLDNTLWQQIAENGRTHAKQGFSYARGLDRMHDIFAANGLPTRPLMPD